jgi:transcriptional regulator with XRE-family HTH domain
MDETLAGAKEPGAAMAGNRLRTAREAAGLSLDDVVARTRVPLRQLSAVEEGRYAELPSPTYAVGFAKAYARAVGADEVAVAAAVRAEIARVGPRQREYEPYEIPDPARVPSRGLAIMASGGAVAVLILLALWYGSGLFQRRSPSPAPAPSPSAAVVARPVPAVAAPGGQVRLTAGDEVWLRVYDADDKTLFLGTMKPGDHFDVPADAKGPRLNVGRPDKLAVTLNGSAVPPLGDGSHAIKDVKVDAASIAARAGGTAASSSPTPGATAASSPAARRTTHAEPHHAHPRVLTETQRANLASAAAARATVRHERRR